MANLGNYKQRFCLGCGELFKPTGSVHKFCSTRCRFWAAVDRRSEIECWPWKKGKFRNGYGQFNESWKPTVNNVAHRMAFFFAKGPIPSGMFVCHSCDNPGCCNPAHLWLGTPRDNVQDMIAKGRRSLANRASGDRHGMRKKKLARLAALAANGHTTETKAP